MSFYWHLNESTGKLVYSNASTYDDGSGGSWLALEQTNMNPINDTSWTLHSYRSSIASVKWDEANGKIEGLTSMNNMFSGCANMASADLSGFDASLVTYMTSMFRGCSSLASLNLSGFDTSLVTNMSSMFQNCSSLVSLDLSGFDTSLVTSMGYMFAYCSSLTSLDLSGFDTSLVTGMYYMFNGCSSLTSLNLSGFDTSHVTRMSYMLYGCSGLISLDLSGFDTSQVTDMDYMFFRCKSLTSLDLSGFDTSQVTNTNGIFSGCTSLTSLDLSGFDTSQVTYMYDMFRNCSGLRILAVSGSMSNVLPELPADQYYPAAGGTAVARADLTAGTWIRDLGDRDLFTSLAQQSSAFKALSDRLGRLEAKVLGSSQAPSYGTSAPGDKLTSIVAQAQAVMSIRRRITSLAKQAAKAQ